jgi:hypothetical protein
MVMVTNTVRSRRLSPATVSRNLHHLAMASRKRRRQAVVAAVGHIRLIAPQRHRSLASPHARSNAGVCVFVETVRSQQSMPESDPLDPYLRAAKRVSLIEVKQNSQEQLR